MVLRGWAAGSERPARPEECRLPPAPSAKAAGTSNCPNYDEQDHGTDRCICDGGDDTRTDVHIKLRHQPSPDKGAGYSDNEIANKPEAGALHNLAGEPTGNDADHHV